MHLSKDSFQEILSSAILRSVTSRILRIVPVKFLSVFINGFAVIIIKEQLPELTIYMFKSTVYKVILLPLYINIFQKKILIKIMNITHQANKTLT